MSLLNPAAGIIAFLGGTVLLFLALGLVLLGDSTVGYGWYSSAVPGHEAAARRTAEDLQVMGVIPSPDGSGKTDIVYREPDGSRIDSNSDGKQWEAQEERREEWAEKEPKRRETRHFVLMFISACIHIPFAILYKVWVVDKIPLLEQRPISTDEDFQQDIFACCNSGNADLCLHAVFCYKCRAAHTWHVAGVCEYWPALLLLFVSMLTEFACCVNSVIYTYFRMKLKNKLGIQSNLMMDFLYSLFCPWCAVAQEAMAVDTELGTHVACCCEVQSPPAIGSVDRFERGTVIQLMNPQLNNSSNEEDDDSVAATQGMERGGTSNNQVEDNPNHVPPGE